MTGETRWPRYRFTSRWTARGDASAAIDALRDLEFYPTWWPEIRTVRQLDDSRAAVVMRSLLPYDLRVVLHSEREDLDSGVLEVRLTGDLDGTTRWSVRSRGDRLDLLFEEDVELRVRWLARADRVLRPVLRANHWLMMRSGERGLRAFLAGQRYAHADRPRRPPRP